MSTSILGPGDILKLQQATGALQAIAGHHALMETRLRLVRSSMECISRTFLTTVTFTDEEQRHSVFRDVASITMTTLETARTCEYLEGRLDEIAQVLATTLGTDDEQKDGKRAEEVMLH